MYTYTVIEGYLTADFLAKLNRLADAGWEIVGQPLHKTGDIYYATLRRLKDLH